MMGVISWIFGSVWRYCVNVEALVTVCSLAFAYRFLFGGGDVAVWEALDRVFVKLELKVTGNYDRVPVDAESRVSAKRTRASWDLQRDNVGVFAIQGRRPYMEDRFNVVNQLEHTDTSIYGIFDGHGGEVFYGLQDNSPTNQLAVSHLSGGLDNSRTSQLADSEF